MEQIDYHHGETLLTGLIVRPSGLPRAAVVLFPTIVNASEPLERRAIMLAESGFLVLIADFYGEPVADFAASQALAGSLRADPAFYRERIAAAIAALRDVAAAKSLPMIAVGYCMGGGAALEATRDGQDLVAAISFHGLLATSIPAQPGAVKARLLVLHGDADPMVPREQVAAFMEEMDHAGANWHLHAYSGVRHGFTDPGSDLRDLDAVAYDASADRQSWAALMAFLDEVLDV
jgi:dienelactone hydrolase